MKQQFVVTHRYIILQQTDIRDRLSIGQRSSMFLRKYKDKQHFCEQNIWTEGVFVTQLSCHAGNSVWWIVWLTTNCRFMSDLKIQSVPCSERSVSIIKTNKLMLYTEIIAVCSETHKNHENTLHWQSRMCILTLRPDQIKFSRYVNEGFYAWFQASAAV
jgi:hypothetical protein